jgi:lipoyl(octanoyl) transferase
MHIRDLGLMDFAEAYSVQERLAADVLCGKEGDTLLLLEHHPVFTLGSGGDSLNVLDPTIQVQRINRGGDVTCHGPGQLVGYPIMDLSRRGRDLHRYLRFLEHLVIEAVSPFQVEAFTVEGRTGVWTGKGKLASIGIGIRRWVTMHGFAVNVDNDLSPFARINPCGMAGCPVTSLRMETGAEMDMEDVKYHLASVFDQLRDRFIPLQSG